MCYLRYTLDDNSDDMLEPSPRSFPYLAWAVPVNAAELGASLEAFDELLPQIQTLRLCHRFGSGSFSAIPQEILDLIIKAMHRVAKANISEKWNSSYACFQGQCTWSSHLAMDDTEIKRLWTGLFDSEGACCADLRHDEDSDPASYDIKEKREMVEEFIDEDGDWSYDTVMEIHDETCKRWLDMLCLCKDRPTQHPNVKSFTALQTVLKSHFGLEAANLNEAFSERMMRFLPETRSPSSTGYFTSSFLILPKNTAAAIESRCGTEPQNNQSFLSIKSHLAFQQKIDVTSLSISAKEKSLFARALRVLDLEPSFHLTELESSLASSTGSATLSEISNVHFSGWPEVPSASGHERQMGLKRYLESEHEELGKQQWPQFMLMADSDVVAPWFSV